MSFRKTLQRQQFLFISFQRRILYLLFPLLFQLSCLFCLDIICQPMLSLTFQKSFLLTSHMLFNSVQLLSHVRLFVTPWTAAHQASLSITNPQSLHKLMSIELVMPSSHLILCHPLLLPPSISPSIRVFSDESVLPIRWPKYWSFSFSISPSNEYSGLISFWMDWLDLIAVQGTLESSPMPQFFTSKILITDNSFFFFFIYLCFQLQNCLIK